MIWRMRAIAANEHPALWHLDAHQNVNGNYKTACGLRYWIAGSSWKGSTPAGACAKCLKAADRIPVKPFGRTYEEIENRVGDAADDD